jgi:negative regulator of sigma E activity
MQMTPEPDDGVLLAAYLAGDLDDTDAATLERRLAGDAELRARLEATHRVLIGLTAVDEVEPPAGFADRLHARLADEQHRTGGSASVVVLDHRRAARRRWAVVSSVAAGVVVLAVAGLSVLGGLGGTGGDMAADEAAEAPAAEDTARIESFAEDQATLESGEQATDGDEAAGVAEPSVLDEQVPLAGEQEAQERYRGTPEVAGVLGTPAEDADALAARFQVALQRAETFGDGTPPARCLDVVTTAADGPLVPVRVETVQLEEEAAIAYILVGARPGSEVLDRAEVWIVESATCATRIFATIE